MIELVPSIQAMKCIVSKFKYLTQVLAHGQNRKQLDLRQLVDVVTQHASIQLLKIYISDDNIDQ